MAQRVVTVNDVLAGHAALDIECLDRIYLNAYRLLTPLLAADQPQGSPELAAALKVIGRHVDHYIDRARLPRTA